MLDFMQMTYPSQKQTFLIKNLSNLDTGFTETRQTNLMPVTVTGAGLVDVDS